ncbi:MAG TPA: hypothetical protein VJ927_01765 [Actinomycetota bacterium]|nr:hypothetical protein [Actinomycetota bacterium]
MRKLIAVVAAVGLVASIGAAPAVAGKKPVKVHESFGASLAPFPKDERWNEAGFTKPGCSAGEQDVHWTAVEFTAPGKGNLRFYMEGFTGDHDIYLFMTEEVFLRGDSAQVGAEMAPPEEEIIAPLKKGQKVTLVACNWAGHPDVLAHYEGTFK